MSGNRLRRALTVALSGSDWRSSLATPASAAPQVPGIPDCKDAPVAQMPGVGLPGFLDEGPTSHLRRWTRSQPKRRPASTSSTATPA